MSLNLHLILHGADSAKICDAQLIQTPDTLADELTDAIDAGGFHYREPFEIYSRWVLSEDFDDKEEHLRQVEAWMEYHKGFEWGLW